MVYKEYNYEEKMKIKSGFVVRKVGNENIAVPIGARGKEFHGMIKLNDSCMFLWNFFKEEHTLDEAVSAMLKEYDVSEEVVRTDIDNFMRIVLNNGFAE